MDKRLAASRGKWKVKEGGGSIKAQLKEKVGGGGGQVGESLLYPGCIGGDKIHTCVKIHRIHCSPKLKIYK